MKLDVKRHHEPHCLLRISPSGRNPCGGNKRPRYTVHRFNSRSKHWTQLGLQYTWPWSLQWTQDRENRDQRIQNICTLNSLLTEALTGGSLMSLPWISKPVVSRIEEEVVSLLVFYYCICAFLCRCRRFNPACLICRHFCCPMLLFQGRVSCRNFTPTYEQR